MVLLTLLAAIGCSDAPPDMRDQRLADFAEGSIREQAKQNEYMARQSEAVVQESQKLAEASKELVAKPLLQAFQVDLVESKTSSLRMH